MMTLDPLAIPLKWIHQLGQGQTIYFIIRTSIKKNQKTSSPGEDIKNGLPSSNTLVSFIIASIIIYTVFVCLICFIYGFMVLNINVSMSTQCSI
jgi:hypothetical protein